MTSAISAGSWIRSIGCTRTGASYNADRRFGGPHRWNNDYGYLVLPGVLGLGVLLPGVLLLLEPLVLGEVVLLPLELGVLELELLPPVAPPLLPLVEESDLKCASHSEREICPSLFLSTIEKLGAELLAPLEALPPLDMLEDPEEPEELEEPVALGALSALEPVDEDPEL